MPKLNNKITLITGGGSGIGKAIAELFAFEGADVHILDMDKEHASAVVEHLQHQGKKASFHFCDVSNQTAVLQTIQSFAIIDILINNAGIAHVGNVEHCDKAAFERVLNVNLRGVYNTLYAAVPIMKNKGGGVILNMASIAALVGISDRFAYSMSKGAVYAMTLSIARDYLAYGIRCNSISPARVHTSFVDGFVAQNYPGKETEMLQNLSKSQPIGRMAQPEEIAQLALFLCSDDASFITGNDYPIDGGFIKLNN
ncbi:glucose 1-dehydrogenase [Sphingobacterium sp. SGG-5]|uniref:SDR family NAD(P)-dependent oxidoreductase n=1 Tax=Sphingobacterium sp. SGG-5 TaxID=2710881 RepID=UPI0013EC06ED|nr:glucose 1-dehydrogenase [Sphingobacterium sp. SGG-5]NGM60933.1 glucose 1-dehydrogenase [Sphingobacterium sp. SGG-5]